VTPTDPALPIDVETNLERLMRLARQPSISEGDRGVRETARLLVDLHLEAGFTEAEVAETDGLPGVWAYLDQGQPRTVVVYLMFDSGPIGGGWTLDPYAAKVASKGAFGRVLFAKGIRTKGPYVAFLAAIEALVRAGERLPVNVACVLDGEEFIGSTHYHDLVERYRDRIPGPIGGINPTCNQGPNGAHALSLANKGCAYLDLRVSGARWGKGPQGPQVHSSSQAVVHSPVWRLVEALATLVDAPGGTHVAIPGFYDDQPTPSPAARARLEALAAGTPPDAWRRSAPGVAGFGEVGAIVDDLSGADLLERALYGTTFNLGGLRAGYVDIDAPLFVLPGVATARADLRYAPPASGRRIVDLLRRHLDATGFPEVEVIDLGTHDGSVVAEDDLILRAAIEVARSHGHATTLWPMRAAGAPVGVITEVLGAPSLGGLGLGFAGSAAGADEYYVLEGDGAVAGFEDQARYYADYLRALVPAGG
jgi:acetylornithine deacetylase/succinyl-diaminopimelate desuccinylase-like protein